MAKRDWRYWEPTFQADEVCELNPVWPWGGHRAFGYDLVRWMRPARIAELGVHWGTSFFTWAQAVKDGRMKDTELVGVDTFEGEEHAGSYGPEVLDTVRGIIKKHFARQQITLHQMLFEKALGEVADESVDLLHIDGLHTLEAVREDFETWLPKLAPGGVVLFHDVAPDTGYGSADYWAELSERHPGFAFNHSWGLGVLFPKGDERLVAMRDLGLDDKVLVYTHRAAAARAAAEVRDLTAMAEERAEGVRKQGEMIEQRDETIARLREQLGEAAPTAKLEAAEKMARERLETMQKQSDMIASRDRTIEKLEDKLGKARALVEERLDALRQATTRAFDAEKTARQLDVRVASAETARDELRARVDDLRDRVRVQDERLSEERETRDQLRSRLDDSKERIAGLRENLAAEAGTRRELKRQVADLGGLHRALAERLQSLSERLGRMATMAEEDGDETRGALADLAEKIEQARKAGEQAAGAIAGRLERLDTDGELLAVRTEYLEELVAAQRERLARGEAPTDEEDWLTGGPKPAGG